MIKTPLLKYKIDHISPSFINQFMLDPVKATKVKFEKIQDEPNMNMFRGTCITSGTKNFNTKFNSSILYNETPIFFV